MALLIMIVLMPVGLYVGASFVAFDMTMPAYPYDEETNNGKEVAIGPRPRRWLCKPSYHGVAYDGHEWPFRLFKPICEMWRLKNGYEGPAESHHE